MLLVTNENMGLCLYIYKKNSFGVMVKSLFGSSSLGAMDQLVQKLMWLIYHKTLAPIKQRHWKLSKQETSLVRGQS